MAETYVRGLESVREANDLAKSIARYRLLSKKFNESYQS